MQNTNHPQLEPFVKHYIIALLWSENDDDGEPFDNNYNVDDMSDEALTKITEDCTQFLILASDLIVQCDHVGDYKTVNIGEYAAHDFLLTRNGHGTGFWDRNLGELGEQLTEISKSFVEMNAFANDDGQIEVLSHGQKTKGLS